jgi:hypothetical protein
VRRLAAAWPRLPSRSFVFSTAGIAGLASWWHGSLIRLLERRGSKVIGQFCRPGWDTVGPLWLIGGLNRGHPSAEDLAQAAEFGRCLRWALEFEPSRSTDILT